MNKFVKQLGQRNTTTWNGAISNSTSGSSVLDYFAKCGSYRGRPCEAVNADMASIFGSDALTAMKAVLYNRMVTRKVKGFEHTTESVQKGQGQRDEFIKSLAWLENNNPNYLYDNLWLIPLIGCWKDLWHDSAATGFYYYINKQKVFKLIKVGLKSEYHCSLLAKYLPKIRSRRHIKNERHVRLNTFARELCAFLGWNEAQYRRFKSAPENCAHSYQRQMCAGEWNELDFNMIPGKALFALLSQKGKDKKNAIERHKLEQKYLAWIKKQPVAKFTGYPYELYEAARTTSRSLIQRHTFDKQFDGLLEKARESVPKELLEKGVLCALDTSGSMEATYHMGGIQDSGIAPIDVCVGLGIYFASLLEGHFHNHVIMFDDHSKFLKLKGESFCGKVDQISNQATAWGGTNFQSVIDEIVRIRLSHPEIPVSDFPQILLCISDMQYSCTGTPETNYEMIRRKLNSVGLPNMTLIFWQVNGQFTQDVPTSWDEPGVMLLSGFDGSIITSLLGSTEKIIDKTTGELRSKNPQEIMEDCLNQEILNKVKV